MLIAQHTESEHMMGADWNTDIGRRNAQKYVLRNLVDIGRPQTGVVAAVMRNTRYTYHKAVKYIKRND